MGKKPRVEAKDWIGLLAIPIVIGFLALGTFMFVELEGFGIRDSLYFCVTMLTTVGYGDFSPETSPGKVAAILFILIGLSLTTTCIGIIFSRAADLAARKDAGPVALPTVKGEFMKMVRALLLILLVNTAGASWAHFHDGFDWLDGFYWAFITSTSVGFGDLETSDATRNFQIGFMILAVIIVANGFGTGGGDWHRREDPPHREVLLARRHGRSHCRDRRGRKWRCRQVRIPHVHARKHGQDRDGGRGAGHGAVQTLRHRQQRLSHHRRCGASKQNRRSRRWQTPHQRC